MKTDEMKAIAAKVVKAGWDAGKDEDDIKMDMFTAKIPFGKLNSLFKTLSIEGGFMADPKEVTEAVKEILEGYGDKIELADWAAVEATVDHIVANAEGATPARALVLFKAHCRDNEIEMPKKPGGGAGAPRAGKLASTVIDLVNGNKAATKQDAYDALYPIVTGDNHHRNVLYYINTMFVQCLAIANGQTLKEAVALLGAQDDPADQGTADPADGELADDEGAEEAMA